jgi:neutral ceramidase
LCQRALSQAFPYTGTAVPSQNTLYNADVYAYVEREREAQRGLYGAARFVHAVVNGTHADNSPDNVPGRQWFSEARRLGAGLGRKAIDLFTSLAGNLRSDVQVRSALREIDYYKNNAPLTG